MSVALFVRRKIPQGLLFLLSVFTVGSALLTFYLKHNLENAIIILAGGSFLFFILWLIGLGGQTVLTINDEGIFDRRLGVGTILWTDIEDAKLFVEYGQRYICLRVKNSDLYLNRMEDPKKKTRMVTNRNLGFVHFNVSIRDLNINLLDLLKVIESKNK